VLRISGKEFVDRRFASDSGAAGEHSGHKGDFAFIGGCEDELVGEPARFVEKVDKTRGERVNAALFVMAVEHPARRVGKLAVR